MRMQVEVRCRRCAERGNIDNLALLQIDGDRSSIKRARRYSKRETERQILAQGIQTVGSYSRGGWEPLDVGPTERIPFECRNHHKSRPR